jgi:hypothetical protein
MWWLREEWACQPFAANTRLEDDILIKFRKSDTEVILSQVWFLRINFLVLASVIKSMIAGESSAFSDRRSLTVSQYTSSELTSI